MSKLYIFYIPCKDEAETSYLSKLLLDAKLIACTNSMPIKSCYFWQGEIQNDDEQVLIAKTLPQKSKEVMKFVEKHHSYDTPCVASWEIEVNQKYFEWVESQM
ncbi:divalent-cation tolerance protein CutA [Bernardetia sp.]|uniref:divalent-cation tolerance protein CutA n=1 Tax=Bernardetia sp. TaxID=1937974 RepID=UPI0025C7053A|nr:divalent-cation tolerance protein CutA [Bernardetia sp.]